MNIVVIGTSDFTLQCAQAVLDAKVRLSALMSMPVKTLPLNSADIKDFAKQKRIPYYEFDDLNSDQAISVLRGLQPDYILSSWPKILKVKVLGIPKFGVIGSHPTDLPKNRGRHPLHWLIVQGMSKTKLSFFEMDEDVDTGRVLLQIPVKIEDKDTIKDLGQKVNRAAYAGVMKLVPLLKKRSKGKTQDHRHSNYWRKRTPHDVTLDLRMPAEHIVRIVRSFSLPYPCANLIVEGCIYKVLEAKIVRGNLSMDQLACIEPGKIIFLKGKQLLVKTADYTLELHLNESLPKTIYQGSYIHPPTKYWSEYFPALKRKLDGLR